MLYRPIASFSLGGMGGGGGGVAYFTGPTVEGNKRELLSVICTLRWSDLDIWCIPGGHSIKHFVSVFH